MKILVACEESQAVTIELRRLGHEAYSCDIEPCSGGHPEWHIQQDVLPLLNGYCFFKTCDGSAHYVLGRWDMGSDLLATPLRHGPDRQRNIQKAEYQPLIHPELEKAGGAGNTVCDIPKGQYGKYLL